MPPIVRGAGVCADKRNLARKLRTMATSSERLAWEVLRDRRCFGLKFRRQQVVRGYVVDFYCAELRLAIEIDGPIHDQLDRAEQDLARALQIVNEADVFLLRMPARLVTEDNLRKVLLPLSRFGERGPGGEVSK